MATFQASESSTQWHTVLVLAPLRVAAAEGTKGVCAVSVACSGKLFQSAGSTDLFLSATCTGQQDKTKSCLRLQSQTFGYILGKISPKDLKT